MINIYKELKNTKVNLSRYKQNSDWPWYFNLCASRQVYCSWILYDRYCHADFPSNSDTIKRLTHYK